jgi:superfamily I DNA and RNA helicase/mRNA-degrading endonuclease RelE of RelBE toxin-antitoxin system
MKVAISSDFFTALSKLPKAQLNKTIKLVEKFKNDPKSPGLNYEKLHFASNMHSIRVDQSYRCIVLSPDCGDVYILLWVDNHDEAYNWAKKHTCSINNETGSLQIIESETSIKESNSTLSNKKENDKKPFFAGFSDKDLKSLGVDENLLEYIKQIDNEVELDNFRKYLPEEVYEALFYLLAGDSVEDTYNYVYSQKVHNVDTNDFIKALENESSKRRFYIVDNDEELMQMLNAPLEKWRVFLHPSQRKLVEKDYNGAVKVLGGAGTGKTVAAMHRAKYLAKQLSFFENKKILFTTFTKNLSLDILENLKKICDEKTMQNIEVINLDSWVHNFLSKHGYKNEIVYDDKTKELWEKALVLKSNSLDLPDSFFKEEWQRVIQPLGINTLEEYIKASRVGRGTRLNRSQRKLIWEVFEEYRYLLSSKNYKEVDDAINDAINIISNSLETSKYSAIVVDEAQDFGMRAFKLLRTLVEEGKNDLFIVGDAHQRIYGHKVVLGQC